MNRKVIFDAVRWMLGRSFTPGEVTVLDNAIDEASQVRKTSAKGIKLIHSFEDCKLTAYLCPAGAWTIGWGATGPGIVKGLTWTQKQADDRFAADLGRFEKAVNTLTGGVTSQAQFDALVSFAYNLGEGSLKTSTLLRKHNEGDYTGATKEFARWNRAAGKVLKGLVRRRAAEAELYATGA